jgi:2-methylcitrate dehydratase PrpD
MHLIDELATFVADHRAGCLDAAVTDTCALLVTDLIGAVCAGFDSRLAASARAAAVQIYGSGSAGVWLTGSKLGIAGAAMANSAAASALDIDDGHRGAAGHPGAGIIPAVLAVAQAITAPDERIFAALTLGYDVGLRIAASRPTPTIETYFSGRWLTYGVAAAAGHLLGLDAGRMAHAMAIGGAEGPIVFPSGSSRYQGSTVKEGIPPAAVAGLTGAFRAQAGGTGPIDLLDRDDRFSRSVVTGGLGDRWWLQDCYLKPYACCRYMHAAVDAIVALRKPGTPILSLRIETFPRGLGLANERAPRTLEGAQYSYYFCCALAAIYGAGALQPIDPAMLHDRTVLDLAARIELAAHDDFAGAFPEATPCRVSIDQGDGYVSLTVAHPLGDLANPMSRAQVRQKFRRIGRNTMDRVGQDAILVALDGLTVEGFRPLFRALETTSP